MTPQKQANQHDPSNGVWGDCYRTCLACVLDLPRDQVPHFMDNAVTDQEGQRLCEEWLASRGLKLIKVALPGDWDLAGVAHWVREMNPGVHHLLSGTSPGGTGHVTVARNGEVVWDPSLRKSELPALIGPMEDGLWWLEFFGVLV